LLVDDHRMFREMLRIPLEAEPDLNVVGEAGSGAQALVAVEALCPDVAVLDIALPDMSGIEVAKKISNELGVIKCPRRCGRSIFSKGKRHCARKNRNCRIFFLPPDCQQQDKGGKNPEQTGRNYCFTVYGTEHFHTIAFSFSEAFEGFPA